MEFRDVIAIRGFSPGTVTFLENQFGYGLKNVIVIVIFRKLIPENKKVACNHFDDESNHKGGTVTGGYGFGYASDMYPSPL